MREETEKTNREQEGEGIAGTGDEKREEVYGKIEKVCESVPKQDVLMVNLSRKDERM